GGGEAGLAELGRQRHGEAAGVRGGDQLFGVGALLLAEAGVETVGGAGQQAALRRVELALAAFQITFPVRGGVTRDAHGVCPFSGWRGAASLASAVLAARAGRGVAAAPSGGGRTGALLLQGGLQQRAQQRLQRFGAL